MVQGGKVKASLKHQLEVFHEECRKRGLRLTPQRLEIFRELAQSMDHPSAEQLHQRLIKKMPTLSLDTIYRTLATFVQYELVNRVETAESQARFEVTHGRHHHLICHKCREIMDFEWNDIDQLTLPEQLQSWGRVEKKSVVVYGTCEKCLGTAE